MRRSYLSGYTEEEMNTAKPSDAETADWQEVECLLADLHAWARAPEPPSGFYGKLLEGCTTMLAAQGGVVWQSEGHGRWRVLQQINYVEVLDAHISTHLELLQQAVLTEQPTIASLSDDSGESMETPLETTRLFAAVPILQADSTPRISASPTRIVIELIMPRLGSQQVQQGWKEFLATVCHHASSYHEHQELHRLRAELAFHQQSSSLLRRIQRSVDLKQITYEIVNGGRNLLNAERVSLLMQNGKRWRLLAVSGVDQLSTRADAVKRLEELARVTAEWGEPFDYTDGLPNKAHIQTEEAGLSPVVTELLEQHVDESHARRLIAVPIECDEATPSDDIQSRGSDPESVPKVVLIAEQFRMGGEQFTCQQAIELVHLCLPTLEQGVKLDHWGVRTALTWSECCSRIRKHWGLSRSLVFLSAVVVLIGCLVIVPTDFEVSVPAKLVPVEEHDVFATSHAKVVQVLVEHGDRVAEGEPLAILDDPQLLLESQRVHGELETVRQRLEGLAISRTNRQVREEDDSKRLPLSAEAMQLEMQLTSLRKQRDILAERHQDLTLRSPIAGTVLTLDAQHLLHTRPVERGQVLFTVADTSSGWKLQAEVPQDQIGHVRTAQQEIEAQLPVRFRLAGDPRETFSGQLHAISEVAVLDPESLTGDQPGIRAEIAVPHERLVSAKPGMDADVKIYCGRRSLGFVWLHSVWENLLRWMSF